MYAKESNEKVHDIYDYAITEFFYYASYIVEDNNRKIKELNRHSLRN